MSPQWLCAVGFVLRLTWPILGVEFVTLIAVRVAITRNRL